MTRRDYCAICNEMVCDGDPMCCNCAESFCYNCPTICDNLSRLVILQSKLCVLIHPIITIDELKSIIEIDTNEIITFCQEELRENIEKKYNTEEEVVTMLTLIRNEFDHLKTNVFISDSIHHDENQRNIAMLKHFFRLCNDKYHIYFEFTCKMCHEGITVQY